MREPSLPSPPDENHLIVADSYLTEAHTGLLNHYFPGEGMEIGLRIIGDILERVPIDVVLHWDPALPETRCLYVMLRYGMRDKPLLRVRLRTSIGERCV